MRKKCAPRCARETEGNFAEMQYESVPDIASPPPPPSYRPLCHFGLRAGISFLHRHSERQRREESSYIPLTLSFLFEA